MAGVRQFEEEAVLEQVLEVFRRKGLRATSMLDLAQATGVQRGSLYHGYGGKEALFHLAFQRYEERFLSAAAQALEDPDPRAALRRFFAFVLANMTMGSPSRGCLTTKTAVELDSVGRAVRGKVRKLLDGLHVIVAASLSRPAARKALAVPPDEATHIVVTFTRGLAIMERVYGDRKRLSATAEALVQAMVRVKVHGSNRPRAPARSAAARTPPRG